MSVDTYRTVLRGLEKWEKKFGRDVWEKIYDVDRETMIETLYAIAAAESSHVPEAVGDNNSQGQKKGDPGYIDPTSINFGSYGLWQINNEWTAGNPTIADKNDPHYPFYSWLGKNGLLAKSGSNAQEAWTDEWLKDPDNNLQAALALSFYEAKGGRKPWKSWSTWNQRQTNDLYQTALSELPDISRQAGGMVQQPGSGPVILTGAAPQGTTKTTHSGSTHGYSGGPNSNWDESPASDSERKRFQAKQAADNIQAWSFGSPDGWTANPQDDPFNLRPVTADPRDSWYDIGKFGWWSDRDAMYTPLYRTGDGAPRSLQEGQSNFAGNRDEMYYAGVLEAEKEALTAGLRKLQSYSGNVSKSDMSDADKKTYQKLLFDLGNKISKASDEEILTGAFWPALNSLSPTVTYNNGSSEHLLAIGSISDYEAVGGVAPPPAPGAGGFVGATDTGHPLYKAIEATYGVEDGAAWLYDQGFQVLPMVPDPLDPASGMGYYQIYDPTSQKTYMWDIGSDGMLIDETLKVAKAIQGVDESWVTYEKADGTTWAYNANDPDDDHKQISNYSRGAFENTRTFLEDSRRWNAEYIRDNYEFDTELAEAARQYDQSFGENMRQFDRSFGEDRRQFDLQNVRADKALAAENYFKSVEELGRNYRSMIQTSPELQNAATNQAQLISQIMKDGGDFLARAYFTRGGISPIPEITQADLINNLYDEAATIQQFQYDEQVRMNDQMRQDEKRRLRDEYSAYEAARQNQISRGYDAYQAAISPTYSYETESVFDQAGYDKQVADQKRAAVQEAQDYVDAISSIPGDDAAIALAQAQNVVNVLNDPNASAADVQKAYDDAGYTGSAEVVDQSAFYDDVVTKTMNTPQTMSRDEWMANAGFGPQLTYANWEAGTDPNNRPTFEMTPLMEKQTFVPNRTYQEQLITDARAVTPPAVESVLQGKMPTAYQLPFGVPTFQQLQALTPDERSAMNTRLQTEFNVPLSDVEWQAQRQWMGGPSLDRNRQLAQFRGYNR